jgi:hypothetical protein
MVQPTKALLENTLLRVLFFHVCKTNFIPVGIYKRQLIHLPNKHSKMKPLFTLLAFFLVCTHACQPRKEERKENAP